MRTYSHRRLVLATAAVADLSGAAAQAASAPVVVKTASNAKLHHTVLVNRAGHTLYSLSAERNGRFICTDDECLSFWTPLAVRRGTKPRGTVGSLGTIRRPDGKTHVTYRGRPLYSFYQDGRGDANGEGFKDVGTWHAVVPSGR
jgi:predicted lipoprotein with Yx(FWY)xxD motif